MKDRNKYHNEYYHKNKKKNKSDIIKIYKLIYNQEVIYIGLTTLTLSRRKSSDNYSVPKEIYKLSKIELIEETNNKGREKFWIEHYLRLGAPLMNKRNGNFSNKEEEYLDRLEKRRLKRSFNPKTKKEKLEKRRKWYKLNKEKINEERRKRYSEKKQKGRNIL
jgi:hypothetical protein